MRVESPGMLALGLAIPLAGFLLVVLAVENKQSLRPDPGDFTAYGVERAMRGKIGCTEPAGGVLRRPAGLKSTGWK